MLRGWRGGTGILTKCSENCISCALDKFEKCKQSRPSVRTSFVEEPAKSLFERLDLNWITVERKLRSRYRLGAGMSLCPRWFMERVGDFRATNKISKFWMKSWKSSKSSKQNDEIRQAHHKNSYQFCFSQTSSCPFDVTAVHFLTHITETLIQFLLKYWSTELCTSIKKFVNRRLDTNNPEVT